MIVTVIGTTYYIENDQEIVASMTLVSPYENACQIRVKTFMDHAIMPDLLYVDLQIIETD